MVLRGNTITMLSTLRHYVLILACLTICCGSTFGAFFAVAPNEFRPGWPLTIAVTVHNNIEGKVFVNAILGPAYDKVDVYTSVADSLMPGETILMTLQVPELALVPDSEALLTVSATGGLIYSGEKTLLYNPTSSLVFVETDKAIYKPGQKVNIRVVHVDQGLKPIIKPLTVVIVNPKEAKLEEYKDTASRTGVVEMTYKLLDSASLGKWKVQVTDDAKMLYTKEFTVEEYVLPKFSVAVKAEPGYIVLERSNPSSVITVEALYTYGKGVQGNCVLTLTAEHLRVGQSQIQITKQLSESGTAEFSDLDWKIYSADHYGSEAKITVKATVTDETGRTEAGQTNVVIYRSNTKIQVLPKSTTVFRLGLEAEIFIRVSDQGGNPISESEVELLIEIPSIKNVLAKVMIPEGQTDVSYKFTPELKNDNNGYGHWRGNGGTVKVTYLSDTRVTVSVAGHLYQSENGSAIAIVSDMDMIPKVGEQVQYRIVKVSESAQPTVGYMIIGQGSIVHTGIPVEDVITFIPTFVMCPHAKLFVYMITGDEKPEVVTDVLDFSPARCFAKGVDVSFDVAEIRSGVNTSMKVRVSRLDGSNALSGVHSVFYLGIDKSLALLQGRTDLNKDEVLTGMSRLDLKRPYHEYDNSVPYTAEQMIVAIGLDVFTSAHMEQEYVDYLSEEVFNVEVASDVQIIGPVESVGFVATANKVELEKVEKILQTENTKVRKHFPETWLWGHGRTDMYGHLSHAVTVPDTITTWLVSAFAINDEGLAVGSGPFELAAIQIFFLTMNLPYSIKRGEVFVLRITVFNYRRKNVPAVVKLASSSQFSVLDSPEKDGWMQKSVEMPANRASSVEFKINATKIGLINLHVIAEDLVDGTKDEVKQKLLVKPEGEMRSRAITKVLLLKSDSAIIDNFFLNWPEDKIVPDSKKVEVKVTGVILGQALSNLQRLVSVPSGCGEQNMITTVPNIYGLAYIRATSQSENSDMDRDMVSNMKMGYQRQVDKYRHRDGSYSAWGEPATSESHPHLLSPDKTSGSVWLTAFVLKSFSRAAGMITVDPTVLSSAAKFLSERQKLSGAFIETGQVFHKEMQSGTASGPSLTVYVLISLLETDQAAGGELLDLKTEIDLAISYIKENLQPADLRESNNKFLAAMGAYALSLIPNSSTKLLLDQLLAVVIDLGAPWDSATQNKVIPGYHMHGSATSDVEIASYYLLALTHLNRMGEAVEIMKWLQSQQNSLGGYYSTQDTVMALQALSDFGMGFKGSSPASLVNVREPQSGQSFNVSLEGSRSLLLHTVELPELTKSVQVTASGAPNSSCVIKVVYTYYTLAGDDDMSSSVDEVSVHTKTTKVTEKVHKVEACVWSSKSLKYNGMFVTTLTLPSGEEALDDPSTILANNPHASRVETGEGLVHFYMSEAPGDGYCLHAQVERQMEFEVQKPGSAKIYAYYEPDTSQEVALALDGSSCVNGVCGNDGAVVVNMASVVLTILVCTLVTLLLCM